MSIYNRSYMKDSFNNTRGEWALKSILIALFIIFLIQNIARHWIGSNFIEQHFALDILQLSKGWIHTLFTYGLLHSTEGGLPWHLLFNSLMLYWFGKEIETRIGSERFLECFLLCIFTGGVIWVYVHYFTQQYVFVVGASAGVFGVLYLFCRYRWNETLSFLFIPVQFTGKQLFWIIFGFQMFFFLFSELPGTGRSVANSAHLGGLLGAYIYEKKFMTRKTLISFFSSVLDNFRPASNIQPPKWERRAAAVKSTTGKRFSVNLSGRPQMKKEVDRILDKINTDGFGALSDEEKQILDKAKDML